MDNTHAISLIQLLAAAIITGVSIVICLRSGADLLKRQQVIWIFSISLILSGVYSLLILLSIKKILPVETLPGGFALVCSCLIAVIAAANRSVTIRLREEISEHNNNKDKINDLLLTDQLTNLYNRRGFISIVEKHLPRLKRNQKKAILFYLKLNNLQEINKKYGYKDGDRVLVNVGTLITAAFRQADIISRIGDNEFMVFLVDADVEDKDTVKNNFQDKLNTYNEKRSSRYKLSVNYAFSVFDPALNKSVLDLISKASASVNQKLYQPQSEMVPDAENADNNLTLIVSNLSSTNYPIDMKIYIDQALAINDTFNTGMQNAWKPFHFKLARGKHTIMATSVKGKTTLEQEFKIIRDHWVSIEYYEDDKSGSIARSLSGKILFHMHDVPAEHASAGSL